MVSFVLLTGIEGSNTRGSWSAPPEIWASIVVTTTLTDAEPPTASLPAAAPPTVRSVTTAVEEASTLTSPANDVIFESSM